MASKRKKEQAPNPAHYPPGDVPEMTLDELLRRKEADPEFLRREIQRATRKSAPSILSLLPDPPARHQSLSSTVAYATTELEGAAKNGLLDKEKRIARNRANARRTRSPFLDHLRELLQRHPNVTALDLWSRIQDRTDTFVIEVDGDILTWDFWNLTGTVTRSGTMTFKSFQTAVSRIRHRGST